MVDDYEQWRSHVRNILQERPDWKTTAEGCDGLEAVNATELHPDIVLLDLSMPTVNGIHAAKMIRKRCPKSKIVFVTENRDSEVREVAIGVGASGYVLKTNAADELLDAIATALR